MSVRDLIPWSRNDGNRVPSAFRDCERDPLLSLHREVNRLFDDVFRGSGSGLPSLGSVSTFGGGWRWKTRLAFRLARRESRHPRIKPPRLLRLIAIDGEVPRVGTAHSLCFRFSIS